MNEQIQTLVADLGPEALEQARRFLQNRYPASPEVSDENLLRALRALKREQDGREIGALERTFAA